MKTTFSLIAFAFLSACSVESYEVKHAEAVCSEHGGWRNIQYGPFPYARCNNGEVFDTDQLKDFYKRKVETSK